MKASPLRRRKGLGRGPRIATVECEVCGAIFQSERRPPRKTCSRVCEAELRSRQQSEARRGERNPNWRGGTARTSPPPRRAGKTWRSARKRQCESPTCPRRDRRIEQHHAVYVQHVRKAGGDEWDGRNSVTLCQTCHVAHHRRGRVLPLSALPDSVFAFAGELLGGAAFDYLRRYYAGTDQRVYALRDLPAPARAVAGGSGF